MLDCGYVITSRSRLISGQSHYTANSNTTITGTSTDSIERTPLLCKAPRSSTALIKVFLPWAPARRDFIKLVTSVTRPERDRALAFRLRRQPTERERLRCARRCCSQLLAL